MVAIAGCPGMIQLWPPTCSMIVGHRTWLCLLWWGQSRVTCVSHTLSSPPRTQQNQSGETFLHRLCMLGHVSEIITGSNKGFFKERWFSWGLAHQKAGQLAVGNANLTHLFFLVNMWRVIPMAAYRAHIGLCLLLTISWCQNTERVFPREYHHTTIIQWKGESFSFPLPTTWVTVKCPLWSQSSVSPTMTYSLWEAGYGDPEPFHFHSFIYPPFIHPSVYSTITHSACIHHLSIHHSLIHLPFNIHYPSISQLFIIYYS